MIALFLAQADVNWIEVIILLVLFGGGAIGAFLKWLVGKFTPDEAKKAPPLGPAPKPTGRSVPRDRPSRPVARPMTPTRQPPAKPMPPYARPQPVGRVAGRASSKPAAPVAPSGTEPRRAEPRRPAPPREVVLEAAASQAETRLERRHLQSGLPEHHLDPGISIRHLGRTDAEDVDAEVIAESTETSSVPTHAELRRAIILRELLGPPIALRRQIDAHEV